MPKNVSDEIDWLIDWYFISKKYTYIYINSTYKQIKSSMCPNIYVPPGGGRQRNYSEFIEAGSLQVDFNMVRSWTSYIINCKIKQQKQ